MAYLDLRSTFDTAAAPAPAPARIDHPHFDDVEWRVIVLAEKEGLASVSTPGIAARFFAWLNGTTADRRLANPRLEALRRFSVLAWHYSYALPVSAISGLLNAGFSEAQIEYALGNIARFRDRSAHRRPA